jgi:ATP-dependent DNA helicase RecQ
MDDLRNKFEEIKSNFGITFDAKDEQLQCVSSVLNGQNVLCFLPTGFGKTLCMAMPTMLKQSSNKLSVSLIISPLKALMEDQVRALNEWNLSAIKLESDMSAEVVQGK